VLAEGQGRITSIGQTRFAGGPTSPTGSLPAPMIKELNSLLGNVILVGKAFDEHRRDAERAGAVCEDGQAVASGPKVAALGPEHVAQTGQSARIASKAPIVRSCTSAKPS
jgi:hypothetical protein